MPDIDNLTGLLNSSKGYSKNPLGIIALFISLIYGLACLVLGITKSTLEKYERLILIIFLVVFPLVILFSFIFLVTKHYNKLYAPSDFKDERNYLETIDIVSQKSRIQNQVIESKDETANNSDSSSKEIEINRLRNYLVVENLILRIAEQEYDLPLRRNVKFKNHESTFDCVFEGKDLFIGVEIKYYYNLEDKHIEIVSLQLRRRFHTFQRIAKEFYTDRKRKFVFYIVSDSGLDSFKDNLTRLFEMENSLEVELKFYKYNYLLEKFGV
jgi:hypothetical protein